MKLLEKIQIKRGVVVMAHFEPYESFPAVGETISFEDTTYEILDVECMIDGFGRVKQPVGLLCKPLKLV